MKFPRALIIVAVLTFIALLATLGSLVQRPFAQFNAAASVKNTDHEDADQAQRFELDGLEFERKLVKGAPFSATLTVEVIPSGSDGNTRTRIATSLIFRDAEGRTRRDRMAPQTSTAELNAGQHPQNSTINDPVAGFSYGLEHGPRLYRRTVFHSWSASGSDEAKIVLTPQMGVSTGANNSRALQVPMNSDSRRSLKNPTIASSETRNEQLGEREIEGVKAEGTRISTSIAKGANGNEQPMEFIVERWYSVELQTPVLIKRSDPRFGEIVYRLRDIKRGEQPATLFVLPSGYKISFER